MKLGNQHGKQRQRGNQAGNRADGARSEARREEVARRGAAAPAEVRDDQHAAEQAAAGQPEHQCDQLLVAAPPGRGNGEGKDAAKPCDSAGHGIFADADSAAGDRELRA